MFNIFIQKRLWSLLVFICLMVSFAILFDTSQTVKDDDSDTSEPGPDSRPSDWAWTQRAFPHWQIDANAYANALTSVRRMKKLQKSINQTHWEFVGPINIGGRVVDIEFNPMDPDILYAAAATGGVFKSMDMGQNWFPIFDDQAVLTIGDICIDPQNPDIIYVGTGEANGGHNNFAGGGVYKSVDGGKSWQFIGLENTTSIGRIRIDPRKPDRVFVAAVGSYFSTNSERGVFMSQDGGLNWERSLFLNDSTGAIDLVMDPQNPDFMLAALWERVRRPVYENRTHLYGESSGIYRTLDGGKTWESLGPQNGLPDPTKTRIGRIGLSLYPENGAICVAMYTDGEKISGLYRTIDGGNQWDTIDPNRQVVGSGTFSWYFGQIRIHPSDPDIIYALDISFMRTTDGGRTWPIKYGYSGYPNLHVDHHALAFHPENPNIIVDGNDGGINISQDAGQTWQKIGNLPVTQFYEIAIDPTHPNRYFGGTQDNGTMRTKTGNIDDWEIIAGGDGFYVNIDPTDPDIIYVESQFGQLLKSFNGGRSYVNAMRGIDSDEKKNWSTPVVMDPHNENVLYYGTNRIYRTDDKANHWTPISPDLTRKLENSRVGTVTTIAIAPSDSTVIYAGTDDGLVWVSDDYGANWQNVTYNLPFRWVTRIAVDYFDPNIAYVTFSGLKWKDPQPHVFRTVSMGQEWQNISNNLPDAPVNAIAVDPKQPHVLYVGTDVGAFYTLNTGQTWNPLGTGMPTVVVNDMKIQLKTYELFAGTHGRSMYKMDLKELTGLESENNRFTVDSFQLYQNYPNPFNNHTVLKYRVPGKGPVKLTVYDALGRAVRTLVNDIKNKGQYSIKWDAKDNSGHQVASGIYYVQLKTNLSNKVIKMTYLK